MKFLKHFTLIAIVVALMVAASSSTSAHPRRGFRGGLFFNTYPGYYDDYGCYGPVYRPAPFSFGYYRGGPRRGFSIGISGRRFGLGFRSDRGRRRHRHDDNRRGNRRGEQRQDRRNND